MPRRAGPRSQRAGSGGAFLWLRAEHVGDRLDRLAPVRRLSASRFDAEGAHCVGCGSTIAEETGACLTGNAHRLMPLHRIDVLGGHRFHSSTATRKLGGKHTGNSVPLRKTGSCGTNGDWCQIRGMLAYSWKAETALNSLGRSRVTKKLDPDVYFGCPCPAGDRPPGRAVARTAPTTSCKDCHSLTSLGMLSTHSTRAAARLARADPGCPRLGYAEQGHSLRRDCRQTAPAHATLQMYATLPTGARTAQRYAETFSTERPASFFRTRR